jgi:hypothetical protein
VAEKLQRCLPVSTGSIEAGASTQGRSHCPSAFAASATWQRDLPGQISTMLSMSHQGAVCVSGETSQNVYPGSMILAAGPKTIFI